MGLGSAEILFQGIKYVIHRRALAAIGRGQALLDGLDGLQPLGKVEEALIGRRLLDDQFGTVRFPDEARPSGTDSSSGFP